MDRNGRIGHFVPPSAKPCFLSRRPLPARNLGDESIEHAEKRALAGRVIETGPLLGP
jgi:hypothetical protein